MIDVLDRLGDDELEAHTSIIITYEFDLTLYEGLIHRTLRAAGVINQMVFCDLPMHIPELDGAANYRGLGKRYSVTPILTSGAFHPKLYLLLGRKRGRLLVGSGNATTGGLLRNAELFGSFEYDSATDAGPHPAFGTCIAFIRELVGRSAAPVQRQMERALAWAPWLSRPAVGDGRELLLSAPGRRPLFEQIRQRLAGRIIERTIVCSSSFDRKLAALNSLASITSSGQVDCIISPDRVDLDGAEVRRARTEVAWHRFREPLAKGQKSNRDAQLHGKLFAFLCEDADIAMFGSANASRPALLTDANTEALVVLPPLQRGSVIEHLGLERSLEDDPINTELESATWFEDPEDKLSSYPVILSAATVHDDGVVLNLARGNPGDDARLALLSSAIQPPKLTGPVTWSAGVLRAGVLAPPGVSLAQLVSAAGKRLSNPVSLTWPIVAERAMSTGVGASAESALSALVDGQLIGMILFDLLGQVPDFEIVLAGGAGGTSSANEGEDETSKPGGSGEIFYTDAVRERADGGIASGDRMDLEILARLIQPLRSGVSGGGDPRDESEDMDNDDAMAEEAQRRKLDAKHKKERRETKEGDPSKPSIKNVERARRRLERRLDRAASSLEKALSFRRRLTSLAPASLARQLWMLRIAAALAGRELPTAEDEPTCCLDSVAFAKYVLRVSRALAGGKDGGLLSLLPGEALVGHDGQTLREGLRFLWSCTIWAAATMVSFWKNTEADWLADDVHDAAPELVAARFVRLVDRYCDEPDLADIERRFPSWNGPGHGWFIRWERRLYALAALIEEVESGTASLRRHSPQPVPGALVLHSVTGLTILVSVDGNKHGLLDLSMVADKEGDRFPVRKFMGGVTVVTFTDASGQVTWREPGWLSA